MKENVLLSAGQRFTEIPRETWEQHLEQAPKEISKMLGFMTKVHHLVRNFVVRELPRSGKPLSPELISKELDMSLVCPRCRKQMRRFDGGICMSDICMSCGFSIERGVDGDTLGVQDDWHFQTTYSAVPSGHLVVGGKE